jgi:nitrate/nitrite transporter NarK
MKLFGWLRQMEFRYVSIFLITVAMYIVGVAWYAYLIRQYEREQEGKRAAAAQARLEPLEAEGKSR